VDHWGRLLGAVFTVSWSILRQVSLSVHPTSGRAYDPLVVCCRSRSCAVVTGITLLRLRG
jgi:hypothetical protein